MVLTFKSVDEILKSLGLTIQMKATEQYFPLVLFIMLYKVVLTFKSVNEILGSGHSIGSYWAALSCIIVYYALYSKVGLTFESLNEILHIKCHHSNESY